jgi:3-deoxy-manno-octulosonate cytidylyltransferase (CMP-KDO synthetase)
MAQALIVIPSRLSATRLPNKPLADICGKPMILHVWERACRANVGPVIVAAGDPEIRDVVVAAGGVAILTDPSLASGSDRVWAAANLFDPEGAFEQIVNVQGDLPLLDPLLVQEVLKPLAHDAYAIGTVAAPLREGEKDKNSVVKIALTVGQDDPHCARALYFSRAPIPLGPGGWHHIGLYSYRRQALAHMVNLPPSFLEKEENLEQLRAMEAGLTIGVQLVAGEPPLGVDTPEDLAWVQERAKGF